MSVWVLKPGAFYQTVAENWRRSATRDPYYVAQRMIILGRTENLLDQFAGRLTDLESNVSEGSVGIVLLITYHS